MFDLYLGPPRQTDVPSTFDPNESQVPLEETIIEYIITRKTTLINPDGSRVETSKQVKTVLISHKDSSTNTNPHQNNDLSGEAQRDIFNQPFSEFSWTAAPSSEKDDIRLNGNPNLLNQKQSDRYMEKKTTEAALQKEKANERQ